MLLIIVSVALLMVSLIFLNPSSRSAFDRNAKIIADIQYTSSGCFHNESEKVSLYKKDNSFFVRYLNGTKVRIFEINQIQRNAILLFINELKHLKEEGGCTTVNAYNIYYQGESFEKIDGSCDWNKYDSVKQVLSL